MTRNTTSRKIASNTGCRDSHSNMMKKNQKMNISILPTLREKRILPLPVLYHGLDSDEAVKQLENLPPLLGRRHDIGLTVLE